MLASPGKMSWQDELSLGAPIIRTRGFGGGYWGILGNSYLAVKGLESTFIGSSWEIFGPNSLHW